LDAALDEKDVLERGVEDTPPAALTIAERGWERELCSLCSHKESRAGDDPSRVTKTQVKTHAVIQIVPRKTSELLVSLKDLRGAKSEPREEGGERGP
jgi:hypothetical protein